MTEALSVPGNVVYQHAGGGEARAPDLRGAGAWGSGSRCLRDLNERRLRFYSYFAQAAFLSGAAVAVIIGVVLEANIDMPMIGFLVGLTFSLHDCVVRVRRV